MSKRILVITNHYITIVNFRLELLERMVAEGCEVGVALPEHERNIEIESVGCRIFKLFLDRKSKNPIKDISVIFQLKRIVQYYKPDVVLTFTIKPNVYGGMVCSHMNIPYIVNITGLGTAVENEGIMKRITSVLYRIALKKAQMVFFQNEENRDFMVNNGIVRGAYGIIPGSGVNLKRFCLLDYPNTDTIDFAFIARVMKEKGIEQFLEAAECIRDKYPNTRFHVCGICEQKYRKILYRLEKKKVIIYHGMVKDIRTIYKAIHCVVHPSYYPEGISNVLLEGAASGRPIITTDRAGCREAVADGLNGYIVKQRSSKSLTNVIEKFLRLSWEQQKKMGLYGRKKVEQEFDREIVVNRYMDELERI